MALVEIELADGRAAEIEPSLVAVIVQERGGGGTEIYAGGDRPFVVNTSVAATVTALGLDA